MIIAGGGAAKLKAIEIELQNTTECVCGWCSPSGLRLLPGDFLNGADDGLGRRAGRLPTRVH